MDLPDLLPGTQHGFLRLGLPFPQHLFPLGIDVCVAVETQLTAGNNADHPIKELSVTDALGQVGPAVLIIGQVLCQRLGRGKPLHRAEPDGLELAFGKHRADAHQANEREDQCKCFFHGSPSLFQNKWLTAFASALALLPGRGILADLVRVLDQLAETVGEERADPGGQAAEDDDGDTDSGAGHVGIAAVDPDRAAPGRDGRDAADNG